MSMLTTSVATAPQREIDGLASHVLLQAGDPGDSALTVTWVEVAPGARQAPHEHAPEQVYVIVSGRGRMRVGDEERDLERGAIALVPSGSTHGITNIGDEPLVYVSAATPAFRVTDLYDAGPLSR
jgi:mannose-6-phosphate isomerase-like protein (cupin superfamily)